jgi:hypothetical protein
LYRVLAKPCALFLIKQVCSDPVCNTTSDPYSDRTTCRYFPSHMRDTRVGYQPNGQFPSIPSTYHSQMYPSSYSLDPLPHSSSLMVSSFLNIYIYFCWLMFECWSCIILMSEIFFTIDKKEKKADKVFLLKFMSGKLFWDCGCTLFPCTRIYSYTWMMLNIQQSCFVKVTFLMALLHNHTFSQQNLDFQNKGHYNFQQTGDFHHV